MLANWLAGLACGVHMECVHCVRPTHENGGGERRHPCGGTGYLLVARHCSTLLDVSGADGQATGGAHACDSAKQAAGDEQSKAKKWVPWLRCSVLFGDHRKQRGAAAAVLAGTGTSGSPSVGKAGAMNGLWDAVAGHTDDGRSLSESMGAFSKRRWRRRRLRRRRRRRWRRRGLEQQRQATDKQSNGRWGGGWARKPGQARPDKSTQDDDEVAGRQLLVINLFFSHLRVDPSAGADRNTGFMQCQPSVFVTCPSLVTVIFGFAHLRIAMRVACGKQDIFDVTRCRSAGRVGVKASRRLITKRPSYLHPHCTMPSDCAA
ncbi:hypothetical protein BKA81DRAFT_380082 [Phyllosticta paracitricarpa]